MADTHTDIHIDKNKMQKRIFFPIKRDKGHPGDSTQAAGYCLGASFHGVQQKGELVAEGFREGSSGLILLIAYIFSHNSSDFGQTQDGKQRTFPKRLLEGHSLCCM